MSKNHDFYFTNQRTPKAKAKPLDAHLNSATPVTGLNEGQPSVQQTAVVNRGMAKNHTQATAPKPVQSKPISQNQQTTKKQKQNKGVVCRCSKAGEKCTAGTKCAYLSGSSQINPKGKATAAVILRQAELAGRQAEEQKRAAHEAQLKAKREQDKRQAELLRVVEQAKERRIQEEEANLKAEREQNERQLELLRLVEQAKERRIQEEKEREAEQKAEHEQNERQLQLLRLVEQSKQRRINEEKEREREAEVAQIAEREKQEKERLASEAEAARVREEQRVSEAICVSSHGPSQVNFKGKAAGSSSPLQKTDEQKRIAQEAEAQLKAQREQDERQLELMRLVEQAKERRANEEKEREQEREAEEARIREEFLVAEQERQEAEATRVREELLAAQREKEENERLAREAARVREELLAAERQRQEEERLAREAEAARIREEFLAAQRERIEQERLAREAEKEAARQARLAKKEAARKAREAELAARRLEIVKREAAFTTQHIVLGSTLITCGAGIDIKHVVSGFESCRITVKNLPPNTKLTEIADLFTQQGIDPGQFLILETKSVDNGKHLEAKVLANAEHGNAIAIGLDGIDFRKETLSFEVTENSSADAMGESSARSPEILTISWRAPSVSMVATYDSMDTARAKAQTLDRTIWNGRRIHAEMNRPPTGPALRYYSPSSVKITGLHPDTNTMNILDLTGPATLKTIKSCLYDLSQAHQLLEQHVRATAGVNVVSFEIKSQHNGGVDGNVMVQVRFGSWEQAKVVRDSLDGKLVWPGYPLFRLSLPDPLQFVSTIPIQQYRAQKRQWDSLVSNNNNERCHLGINIYENERVAIRVRGDDKKAVGSLKVRVETLVAGERLDVTYWHRSFTSPKGRQFLNKVSTDTGAHVRSDWKIHALKIYGDDEVKQEARQLILAEIERLSLLEWTVPLKRQSVGYFVRKGLAALQEILGEDSVTLDLTTAPGRITIKGGEEARHHLTIMLDESLKDTAAASRSEGTTDICPICYDTVSHPVQLGCDHKYCTACIRHYLTTASDSKNFPLTCMGNEAQCHVPIPIQLIQRFLPPQKFDQLVNVAFSTYIDLHPQDFRYCTTPDCVQIYRCNSGASQKCPSCFAVVCSECHEEAHDGMTCAERALHKNPAEQERLNENWAAENGVKKCPSCKVWIEKTEGCNHMTCKCGAHICWRCMGIFEARDIYNHLNDVHGGAFEHAAVDNGTLARQREFEARQQQPRVFAFGGAAGAFRGIDEERIDRLREQRAAEALARHAEDLRRAQLEARQEQLRAERRRQADIAAEAERQRVALYWQNVRAEEQRRQEEAAVARRQAAAQREKDSSWCVIM